MGHAEHGIIQIRGSYYHVGGNSVNFVIMGNRWVSIAGVWDGQEFEVRYLLFRGQVSQLEDAMTSGSILEHPEWLAVLPPDFAIEKWEIDPGSPKDFELQWDQAQDLELLTVETALRLGVLYQPMVLETQMALRRLLVTRL